MYDLWFDLLCYSTWQNVWHNSAHRTCTEPKQTGKGYWIPEDRTFGFGLNVPRTRHASEIIRTLVSETTLLWKLWCSRKGPPSWVLIYILLFFILESSYLYCWPYPVDFRGLYQVINNLWFTFWLFKYKQWIFQTFEWFRIHTRFTRELWVRQDIAKL